MNRLRILSWLPIALVVLTFVPTPAVADDLPRAKPEAVGLSADRLKKIDSLFTQAVADKQIAGGVVLLARRGKVGYLQGIGRADLEADRPMAPDIIFRIASMSKPVTSVAVMMLVDDGKLRLDDPVSKYLPEFADQKVLVRGKSDKEDDYKLVRAEREVTVRDLITHTSGIAYRFFAPKPLVNFYIKANIHDGLSQDDERLADNIKRLAGVPLLHQPGSAWTYGLNTDVLGRVVEVASGKNLDEFFRERIFEPLGMRDTAFYPPAEKVSRIAALYRPGEDKKIVRVGKDPVHMGELTYTATYPYEGPRTYFSGGAGLTSTAGDYARFLQMLLDGGKANGKQLLKSETVKQMTQNQIGKLTIGIGAHGDAFGYGFGVVTPNSEGKTPLSVGSYSWGGIFYTYFWVDPRKELIGVMMTQVFPSDHLKLRENFAKLAYEALID
jgi:CubicO group peptidase (beta-lactamase class C family)